MQVKSWQIRFRKVSVYCVCVKEFDLERMKAQWLDALTQRQDYLDQQLQKIVSKTGTHTNTHILLWRMMTKIPSFSFLKEMNCFFIRLSSPFGIEARFVWTLI